MRRPNKITGANLRGRRTLQVNTGIFPARLVAQFRRSAMNAMFLVSAIMLAFTSSLFADIPKDITKVEDIAEYKRGVAAATDDLKKGVIKYEIIGEPLPTDRELKDKAKKTYNIEIVLHGCVPGPRVLYDRGYLDTVIESLKKKYGFDPVKKLDEDLRSAESTKSRTNQSSEREPSGSRR